MILSATHKIVLLFMYRRLGLAAFEPLRHVQNSFFLLLQNLNYTHFEIFRPDFEIDTCIFSFVTANFKLQSSIHE